MPYGLIAERAVCVAHQHTAKKRRLHNASIETPRGYFHS
jgi:hypothetical protein